MKNNNKTKSIIDDYIKKYGNSQYKFKKEFEKYITNAIKNDVNVKTIKKNLKAFDENLFKKIISRQNKKAVENYTSSDYKFIGDSFNNYINKFLGIKESKDFKKIFAGLNTTDRGKLLAYASAKGKKVNLKELYYGDNGTEVVGNDAPYEFVEKIIDFLPGERRETANKFLNKYYENIKSDGGFYEDT